MPALKSFPNLKSSIRVQARAVSPERLEVTFSLGALILPRSRVFGLRSQQEGLWRSLCFEVFFRPKDRPGYFECNVSPKGDWALYEFTSYRQPQPPRPTKSFHVEGFMKEAHQIQFVIRGPFHTQINWQLGYSVVVPQENGAFEYLALHHAAEKPDFHHPLSFVDHIRF